MVRSKVSTCFLKSTERLINPDPDIKRELLISGLTGQTTAMCNEYKTTTMWSGNGCKADTCYKIEYTADPCNDKPATGIRNCRNYKLNVAGSSRKKGPKPGHNHGAQESISGTTK